MANGNRRITRHGRSARTWGRAAGYGRMCGILGSRQAASDRHATAVADHATTVYSMDALAEQGRSTIHASGTDDQGTGMIEHDHRTVAEQTGTGRGMTITRYYTTEGLDPFASVQWTTRTSRITNPDGSVVFEMKDAEVPVSWSQVATDIM